MKVRKDEEPEHDPEDTTDITVRGIDAKTYDSFSAFARKTNTPIGKLLSDMLGDFLEEQENPNFYYIQHMGELKVTKDDLKSTDKQYVFRQIMILTFEEGVTWELFSKSVAKIRNVNRLFVPQNLPKLQVLSRCGNIGEIVSRGEVKA